MISFPQVRVFPGGSAGKKSAYNAGDLGLIPGLGRENSYPFQYSGLENSMDCIVHAVAKNRTLLRKFHSPQNKTLNKSLVDVELWDFPKGPWNISKDVFFSPCEREIVN